MIEGGLGSSTMKKLSNMYHNTKKIIYFYAILMCLNIMAQQVGRLPVLKHYDIWIEMYSIYVHVGIPGKDIRIII